MSELVASAPGKLVLFGEYAVLLGHRALVAALDVQARCVWQSGGPARVDSVYGTHVPDTPELSALPFVAALFEAVGAPTSGQFLLESGTFGAMVEGDWQKFGLGSSAATTVSLAAALAASRGQPVDRDGLYRAAQTAHRTVQGGGSGIDIAASTFGGVMSYRWSADEHGAPLSVAGQGAAEVSPLTTGGLASVWVAWTGQSASTPTLIAAFHKARAADPHRVGALCQRLADAAAAGADAWSAADLDGLAAAAQSSTLALERLGEVMGHALVTDRHRTLGALARPFGAVVKSTGAGAGDLAWIIPTDPSRMPALKAALEAAGFPCFEHRISPTGVVTQP